MCTQTIRLSSLRCRALILKQPGLPPVTSCPFSVRRWSHRKRDSVGTWMGRQRKGLWAEKELEERLKERGADRRKTALTHMLLISRGEGGDGGGGGESGRQGYWNCLAACPCPCLATVSVPQWQTYECLAEATEGVLQSHRGWKRHTSVWQMKRGLHRESRWLEWIKTHIVFS